MKFHIGIVHHIILDWVDSFTEILFNIISLIIIIVRLIRGT